MSNNYKMVNDQLIELTDAEQLEHDNNSAEAIVVRDNDYGRKRRFEYPSINDLIVALWENVVEERASAVVSLEADRQAVKTKYPKP